MKRYCIIGAGLAGLSLAARLVLAGENVILIDDANPNAASRLAAGMFNIVTGKHAVKTWLADELLSELNAFFEIPSFEPLKQFIHYQTLYRPFKAITEYNDWLGKYYSPELKDYIRFQTEPIYTNAINNPLGGIFIDKCGWLDTANFLVGLTEILSTFPNFQYIAKKITPQQIELPHKKIHLTETEISFDEIILAHGSNIAKEAIWQIPLLPVKGEILRIYAPELQIPFLLSGKVYIIPIDEDYFTVGATYEWKYENDAPTPEGKQLLSEYLTELLGVKYEIVMHRAGIRPTTHDRRPVLGTHPAYPYLHVFTGFGTKGVLSFAYFSKIMAGYLRKENSLVKEYDVQRYYRKGKMGNAH